MCGWTRSEGTSADTRSVLPEKSKGISRNLFALAIIISIVLSADLSAEADTKKVMEETIKEFGRLDILVNNAGVIELGTIENTSLEQYDRVMNVNVR